MKKLDVPSSPIVLGLILGPMIEKNFHQAMVIYDGSFMFLLTRPVSLLLMIFALWSLASGIRRTLKWESSKKTVETKG
jgi:putative tricarboxylic transport membrane protein